MYIISHTAAHEGFSNPGNNNSAPTSGERHFYRTMFWRKHNHALHTRTWNIGLCTTHHQQTLETQQRFTRTLVDSASTVCSTGSGNYVWWTLLSMGRSSCITACPRCDVAFNLGKTVNVSVLSVVTCHPFWRIIFARMGLVRDTTTVCERKVVTESLVCLSKRVKLIFSLWCHATRSFTGVATEPAQQAVQPWAWFIFPASVLKFKER